MVNLTETVDSCERKHSCAMLVSSVACATHTQTAAILVQRSRNSLRLGCIVLLDPLFNNSQSSCRCRPAAVSKSHPLLSITFYHIALLHDRYAQSRPLYSLAATRSVLMQPCMHASLNMQRLDLSNCSVAAVCCCRSWESTWAPPTQLSRLWKVVSPLLSQTQRVAAPRPVWWHSPRQETAWSDRCGAAAAVAAVQAVGSEQPLCNRFCPQSSSSFLWCISRCMTAGVVVRVMCQCLVLSS